MHILIDEEQYKNLVEKEGLLYEIGSIIKELNKLNFNDPGTYLVLAGLSFTGTRIANLKHSTCITQQEPSED